MRHEPERNAAAYLGGVMRPRRLRRFEEHLVDCEDCWREVSHGRRGRRLAESARDLAPQRLRETVRAAIAAAPVPRRRLRLRLPHAALAVAVVGAAFSFSMLDRPTQPEPIAAAVSDFRDGRVPGMNAPAEPAPDLSAIALTVVGEGAGALGDNAVAAYSYRSPDGARLVLYVGTAPFPVASGARQLSPDGPWRATVAGIELLCSEEPHTLLAVSDDARLLASLAAQLEIDGVPA